jgi:hypothetical protein
MAYKKHTTNPSRFSVETVDSKLVIWDAETWTFKYCKAGTTRAQAARECAALNGTGSAKAPRDPPSIEGLFRKRGGIITFEEIEQLERAAQAIRHPIAGPLDPDIYGKLRTHRLLSESEQRRKLTAACEQWLPGALTDWGAKVAEQYGYAGPKRKNWQPYQIIGAWQAADHALETKLKPDIKGLHRVIWPAWRAAINRVDFETCQLIVLHFASEDPARIKARLFGVEKRAYLNHVKAAIQTLARWHVSRLIDDAEPDLSRGTMTSLMDSWSEMLSREEQWQRDGDK